MSPTATTQNPQPIIDLLLADINGVIPNFTSLVSSYRLLVGSAEEIQRTPNVCPEVFERAVKRYDNAGLLIDVLLELLCCKILFTSELLQVSYAPIDLFRLISNPTTATDTPFHTAEQVVGLELLLKLLNRCREQCSCLPDHPVVCPDPPAPVPPPPPVTPPETASQPAAATPDPRQNPAPPGKSSDSKKEYALEKEFLSRVRRKNI